MALNRELLSDKIVLFKITSVIVGLFCLSFMAAIYYSSASEFYLSMAVIFFILSLILIILMVLEIVSAADPLIKKIDMGYHILGALLLGIGALVFFFTSLGKGFNTWWWIRAIIATVLGLGNAVIYGFIAFLTLRTAAP